MKPRRNQKRMARRIKRNPEPFLMPPAGRVYCDSRMPPEWIPQDHDIRRPNNHKNNGPEAA